MFNNRYPSLKKLFITTLSGGLTLLAVTAPAQSVWTPIGPAPVTDSVPDSGPNNNETGRIIAVAVHPTNPKIVFIGTADGGLYRSLDGGSQWTAVDFPNPTGAVGQSLAVSAIAFVPSDPTTIFVGTGQPRSANNALFGVGVYRVKNADTTPVATGPYNLGTDGKDVFTGRSISKVLVSPDDANVVFVAVGPGGYAGIEIFGGGPASAMPLRGLYRTNMAMSDAPKFTRLTDDLNNVPITDMVFEPGNASTLLFVHPTGTDTPGGVFRTTDALAPKPAFTNTLPMPFAGGLTMRLAINKVGGVVTVLLATNEKQPSSDAKGTVKRSVDGGVTWSEPIAAANGFGGPNLAIDINPNDAKIFYLGGASKSGYGKDVKVVAQTLDGGLTFSNNASTSGLHPDTQVVLVAPSDPSQVYVASDGGIWKTTKGGLDWVANPPNWEDLNTGGLSATQLNSISQHPKIRNFMLSGAQDNGSPFRGPDGTWVELVGGDGGVAVIDQNATINSDVVTYHNYDQEKGKIGFERIIFPAASLGKATKDLKADSIRQKYGAGGGNLANGISADDDVLFYNPMVLGPGTPNTLYFGTDRLYRSADQGVTMTLVSQGPLVSGKEMSAIGISPQDDNVRVVGLVNGQVFGTANASSTLTEITPVVGGNKITNYVSRVVIDPTKKTRVYVVYAGFGLPDKHIMTTDDFTATPPVWTPAGKGLPDAPANVMVIDPSNSNLAYAGTDVGVFASKDGGANWALYGSGLPRVAVFDLIFQSDFKLLRAGTYGRGVYEIDTTAAPVPAPLVAVPARAGSTIKTRSTPLPRPISRSQATQKAPVAAASAGGKAPVSGQPPSLAAGPNFSNPATITINDAGPATPYPSTINVSGLTGVANKVSVQLNGLTHSYPDDVDVLLVGPHGQKVILMSDAGGGANITGVNLTFDDGATNSLPLEDEIVSGKYKPTDYEPGDVFPAAAPAGPYGTSLAAFNGLDPNGTWQLFVVDDSANDAGAFTGGWSLAISTQADATLPSISASDIRVEQGESGTNGAIFTVRLSKPSTQAVSVNYATSDGTATAPADYASRSGTLTFAPGETSKTITVAVNGTTATAADKTFFLNLSNATNAAIADNQAAAIIVNDNVIPEIAVGDLAEPKAVDVASGDTGADFTITLSGRSNQEVRVDYASSDGTMIAGTDYEAISGTLIFPPGTLEQIVTVQIIDQPVNRPDGTLFMNLSNPVNGTIVKAQGRAIVVLEKAPSIVMQPEDQEAGEGSTVFFAIESEGGDPMTFQWSFNGVPIPGATEDVLEVKNIKAANAGSYSVVVTTPYGTEESDSAQLVVLQRAKFASVSKSYQGLIGGDTFEHRSSGYVRLFVSPTGAFSGIINYGGTAYRVRGKFAAAGQAAVVLGAGAARLTVRLQLDLGGDGGISGTVSAGGVTSALFADAASTVKTTPARYTILLPRNPDHPEAAFPQGDGFGFLIRTQFGAVHFVGRLGDNTPISLGSQLSPDGFFPFFASAYKGAGSVSGWVELRDLPGKSDLDGALDWSRPELFGKQFPAGFTTTIDLIGSLYVKPAAGQPVLDLSPSGKGTVTIDGGNLPAPLTETISLDSANRVVVTSSGDRFTMAINLATGGISGSFTPAGVGGAKRTYLGALQQKSRFAGGVFSGTDQTGFVELAPQ